MFEFQDEVGIPWLGSRPRSLLADEPGLGKTRQLILAAEGRTLVVAPAMVLDGGVWADELQRWRPDLDATCVSYTSLCDRKRGPRGGWVPMTRPAPQFAGHWDTVIFDESHYLKGRSTRWTEAAMKLQSDKTMLASGTPIPSWAHELYTSCQLLWPEKAKPGGEFGSYWRWVAQWFDVGPTRFSPMEVGDPLEDTPEYWKRFYDANLGDRFLMRKWEDVLEQVPPMRFQQILCPMKPAQAKAYREMKKNYLATTESGEEIVAWSAGGKHVKMARIATGLQLEDRNSDSSGKLEQLHELLRQRTGTQTFVVGQFRSTVELAAEVAQKAGCDSAFIHGGTPRAANIDALRRFKSGDLPVLVGTIDTLREGLSFEKVSTVVRVERSWLPSRNEQVVRRIRRVSNLTPKLCIDLVTPNSVDAKMLPVLASKTDQQMKALRAGDLAKLL